MGAGAGQGAMSFEPIEPLRAHEYVAEQISRHIRLGLIGAGEALPPERELAKIFGVGRATIQAALRLLEADRLIESRRGRKGGTFVIEPLDDLASRERSLLEIRLARDKIEDALRYRQVVEAGAAERAAVNRTANDIALLSELAAQMKATTEERESNRLDTEFHVAVALASHSQLLRNAVEQSRLVLNEAILAQPETDVWRDRILSEHDEIIQAIEEGASRRAGQAMRKHVIHTEQGINALLAALK